MKIELPCATIPDHPHTYQVFPDEEIRARHAYSKNHCTIILDFTPFTLTAKLQGLEGHYVIEHLFLRLPDLHENETEHLNGLFPDTD